jgi:hypothetical protein
VSLLKENGNLVPGRIRSRDPKLSRTVLVRESLVQLSQR